MSLPDELLLSIVNLISGKEGVRIAEYLEKKPEATDNEISEATDIPINDVRKVLYQLYNSSLATYRKTRNMDTGWFIYHWSLQPARAKTFMRSQEIRILRRLKLRLEHEKAHDFYWCLNPDCSEMPFEEALDVAFRCPRCHKPLKHFATEEFIQGLESKIKELQNELKIA
ncbi:MAG: transcription factor [Candidatus Bathyarchaeia archaeon]